MSVESNSTAKKEGNLFTNFIKDFKLSIPLLIMIIGGAADIVAISMAQNNASLATELASGIGTVAIITGGVKVGLENRRRNIKNELEKKKREAA